MEFLFLELDFAVTLEVFFTLRCVAMSVEESGIQYVLVYDIQTSIVSYNPKVVVWW